ncbi:hypothetical protein [Roseimicrobium sp. ORNL1]|uniref:hypothetical protein n=1 Tax=Roseimicrobium sp. ORNL1 TaxID=2711231 RepID=UPI0013E1CAAC|nr:hypothetical protein [Roseimicrobium sp. ORNL1]QIF02592.1 hypothetical protein G5S37_14010 [Roseimicrobium sp. ORNL1]
MSTSPSAHLVAYVQRLIQETFEVSEAEAKDRAAGFVALAEGLGTPGTAAEMDWLYRVRKDLGRTLKWRSETVKLEFETAQKQAVKAYELLIDPNKGGGWISI